MENIKKLLKLDFKSLQKNYICYISILLILLILFGNMTFNMGTLILVIFYTLKSDSNYKKVNTLIKILPINNKEFVLYKYASAFLNLIFVIVMFLITTIIILIAEKILDSKTPILILTWLSERILIGHSIESNYFIRFVVEVFMGIATICVIIPTNYNKSKKYRICIWLGLIFANSMVGSCLTRDYTWVIYDLIGKLDIVFIVIIVTILSGVFIKLSFNKTLNLYSKCENI